ncbi:hypothetical protein CQZ98_27490 [Pseudomonas sp. MYb115]|nr:hypothetical protein CQZ98_27490 [Pseudomonas sp. MYb115]
MVLAPRCLYKRSTALMPFPLAPLFATLQTLIRTDRLARRVHASIFGLTSPVPALPRRRTCLAQARSNPLVRTL